MRNVLVVPVLAALLASAPFGGQALAQRGGQQGLTDAQRQSAAMEVPRLIDVLELQPGMAVADIGAGFGAWTMTFAKAVGPSGRVFATDIGDTQLAMLREMAQREGLFNVTVLEGAARSTNLPARCCDAILIRDAYHHMTEPADILGSMLAALKPGGRLAVIDFPPRPNSDVPDGVPADRGGHGVPMDIVVREATAAGFASVSATAEWSPKSQPGDLFLAVFQKPAN